MRRREQGGEGGNATAWQGMARRAKSNMCLILRRWVDANGRSDSFRLLYSFMLSCCHVIASLFCLFSLFLSWRDVMHRFLLPDLCELGCECEVPAGGYRGLRALHSLFENCLPEAGVLTDFTALCIALVFFSSTSTGAAAVVDIYPISRVEISECL
ncbi:hypothetical protein BKA65DRAFT_31077 [Rhexocercosporidium sp. MPI-PUGE-AT-0058]|nr:hypothetical protein BKA65DRAFT_31077 [Rhexocercosporidium sp. MPI-PUGE-AT-0058]